MSAQGEQGGGGLMSGVDEEDAVRDQVLAVLAVCVPGGQCAHQVISWRCGALVEKPGEVGEHLLGGVVGGLDCAAVGITLAGEASVQDGKRLAEPVPVPGRDAEYIVDHGERQRLGEVGDQVHAPGGGRLVDQRAGPLGDDRPVTPDPAGGEQAAERIPDAAVPVAVQPDHPPPEHLECRVRGGWDGRRRKTRIAQHIAHERVLAARQRRAAQDHVRVSAPCGREQRTQQVELGPGSRRAGWNIHVAHSFVDAAGAS
jgi:hypothetical protein